jgi:hypothetical protein
MDETTVGQLAGILYEIDSQGRIKIESKEDARKRGVPSPDRADALMLALGELPRLYEYRSMAHPDGPVKSRGWIMPRNGGTREEQNAFDDLPARVRAGIVGHGLKRGHCY